MSLGYLESTGVVILCICNFFVHLDIRLRFAEDMTRRSVLNKQAAIKMCESYHMQGLSNAPFDLILNCLFSRASVSRMEL